MNDLDIYKDVDDLINALVKFIRDASGEAITCVFDKVGRKENAVFFGHSCGLLFIEDGGEPKRSSGRKKYIVNY